MSEDLRNFSLQYITSSWKKKFTGLLYYGYKKKIGETRLKCEEKISNVYWIYRRDLRSRYGIKLINWIDRLIGSILYFYFYSCMILCVLTADLYFFRTCWLLHLFNIILEIWQWNPYFNNNKSITETLHLHHHLHCF